MRGGAREAAPLQYMLLITAAVPFSVEGPSHSSEKDMETLLMRCSPMLAIS